MTNLRRAWTYGLTANVVALSVVSLLTDISSEMILPILPFFLTQVLLANALIVGAIEGLAESVVSVMKAVSGRWSDRAGKRKGFVFFGYGLSAAMKVLFPFAASWPQFLGMRTAERMGKGIRDAPRDALLTESTPPETRGKMFGFHRSMDTTGAIVGPLITLGLLAGTYAAVPIDQAYRAVFLLAAFPAVISVSVLSAVREPTRASPAPSAIRLSFRGLPRPLLVFIGIASLFAFAEFSYIFLLLRVGDVGGGTTTAIVLYVVFNIVYAALAYPAGTLSDRFGRKRIILIGYGSFAVMAALLAATANLPVLVVGFILYGIVFAMVEGTQRALVSDLAPEEKKGTALGVYHMSVGLVRFPASVVAGFLWVAIAPGATFWFGFVGAVAAGVVLVLSESSRFSAWATKGKLRS